MHLGFVPPARGNRSLSGDLRGAANGSAAAGLSELLGHAAWRSAADRVDQHAACRAAAIRPTTSLPPASTSPSAKHLEKAILDISAREQRRIGQDLHDGLGQHLTGIAFMAKVHEAKLAEQKRSKTDDAAKIVKLVNEAIHKTRELARGLLPVVSDSQGLMSALQLWAAEVEDLFGISCRFQCDTPVLIHDDTMATHLYHIAQEAVNNAIKHGRSAKDPDSAGSRPGRGTLVIKTMATGLRRTREGAQGMGLHIMNYRAGMIGGTLEVRRDTDQRNGRHLHLSHDSAVSMSSAYGVMTARSEKVDREPRRRLSSSSTIIRLLRQGLALLINREQDLVVCGEAEEAQAAMQGDRRDASRTS